MTLVVSGANGFTGRYFSEAAAARGMAVAPLRADIRDRDAVAREIAALAPTRVLHLAGISFAGHDDARAVYEVNLIGTVHLLDALRRLPVTPERVVLASSAMVYGLKAPSPISEQQPACPVSHYAISKLAMEHAARACGDQLPTVIARAFNYTGPGQSTQFLIPKLVEHFRCKAASVSLGQLDVEREFNDVRFVCEAYLGLLQHGEPGETYNLCTGRPVSVAGVIEALSALTGHRIAVETEASLLRTNEIPRLYGNPAKLQQAVAGLPELRLEDTLRWMLGASQP